MNRGTGEVLSLAEVDQLSETTQAEPLPILSRLTPEKPGSSLASEIAGLQGLVLRLGAFILYLVL